MKLLGTDMRRLAAMMAAVFAVTLAVYLPSASYEFVDYDDTDYVLKNEHMRDGLTGANIAWAWTSRGYADNWHPLTWMSLMADVSVLKACSSERWGTWDFDRGTGDAWFSKLSHLMHFHNVLLHAANAALLFLLIVLLARRAGKEENEELRVKSEEFDGVSLIPHPSCLIPLFLSLLWALHPLRVEVVCWVSERKEVLSCFWMLLTLLLYCCGEGTRRPTSARNEELRLKSEEFGRSFRFSLITYHLSLLTYAAAAASKPVAVTLPAVLVAWDWIFLRRLRIVRMIPFAVLALLTCLFTMQSQGVAMDVGADISIASRLSTIFVGPLVYIRQTLWPFDLAIIYEATRQVNLFALAGGVALSVTCVVLCIVWFVRRVRHFALDLTVFAIAWIYIGLLPMMGIVKVGCQEHCDRYTYWIGCGVCVVLAMVGVRVLPVVRAAVERFTREQGGDEARVAKEWGDFRKLCLCCAGALVLALGCITWQQMGRWRNTIVLYRDAVPKSWSTEIAKILAAQLARQQGQEGAEEGLEWLRKCATNHRCPLANLNLAEFMLAFKRTDPLIQRLGGQIYTEEEQLIQDALALEPDNKDAKRMLDFIEERRKDAK